MAPQASAASTHLPHQLTSFVGRSADLRGVKDQLTSSRLVTLVGTGGVGKSRLAIEVARANESRWPDGVWWVELASASEVGAAAVSALELPGRGAPRDVVAAWLAARQSLLILDNCEHLIEACAELAQALLERCPQLNILATSREPLGVPGEVRWLVTSLDDADAVRLFEARARLVAPGFRVAEPNLRSIAEICARLDRLPLAIEMAAARLDVMSEADVLENLDDRMQFLRSAARGTPERQQTMAAAIDWSYRLLTAEEARLFRRLAVFRGGFTLEAAGSVGGDSVLEPLTALVRKSMVVAERLADGSTRYRLLESHHAFAAGKLQASGELDEVRKRHYDYFVSWLDAAKLAKRRPSETENLWSAVDWARTSGEDSGLALAIKLAEFEYSDQARMRAVLLDLLDTALAASVSRAKAMNLAARLVVRQGDHVLSKSLADSSVELARQLGDRGLLADAIRGAGFVYHTRGEVDTAAAMYSEALSLLDDSADQALAVDVKNALGLLAVERGDHDTALALLTECVEHSRGRGDQAALARYLESLANAQLAHGDVEAAVRSWAEALPIFRDLSDAFGTIWCLGGLALAAAKRGDLERALRLASATERVSREWSLTAGPFRLRQLSEAVEQARTRLGEQRAQAAWREGQTMAMARATEYALGAAAGPAPAAVRAGPLTRREREVAALVAAGLTNRQIAERLFISERTAEGHVERIRDKLGVRSRTEVATWAVARGLTVSELDKPSRTSTV